MTMTDRPPLEDFILSLVNAARELGVDRERARILRLIDNLPTAMTGGPELKDRIVRAITDGGKA